jgi:hypothetical protein
MLRGLREKARVGQQLGDLPVPGAVVAAHPLVVGGDGGRAGQPLTVEHPSEGEPDEGDPPGVARVPEPLGAQQCLLHARRRLEQRPDRALSQFRVSVHGIDDGAAEHQAPDHHDQVVLGGAVEAQHAAALPLAQLLPPHPPEGPISPTSGSDANARSVATVNSSRH